MPRRNSQQIILPNGLFKEFHKGFSFIKKQEVTPAQGFRELHDAVCEAFARIDLTDGERENVNNLINSLENMAEDLKEQQKDLPDADGYFVENTDLQHIIENIRSLGDAIRMHQTELARHDIANALLWFKTALKRDLAQA